MVTGECDSLSSGLMRTKGAPAGILCAADVENIKVLTSKAPHEPFQYLWPLSELPDQTEVFLGESRRSPPIKQACLPWNLPCAVSVDQEDKPKEFEK